MAIHIKSFGLNKEALAEALLAAELLINTPKKSGFTDVYGYSAAVLLFSFINTVGHLILKKTNDKQSFCVLMDQQYFKKVLPTKDLCEKLYKDFRCKLTHNLSLPNYIYLDTESAEKCCFKISTNDNNGGKFVSVVYIKPLLQLCKNTLDKLAENHEALYNGATSTEDIGKIDYSQNSSIQFTAASGITKV